MLDFNFLLFVVCIQHTIPLMKRRAESDSPEPAYQRIIDWLRVMLVSGELKPGTTLPPVRSMALDLNVHFHTVAAAYRALAEEGWLDLRRGSGARVIERTAPVADSETLEEFVHRLRTLIALMRARGVPVDKLRTELHALAQELKP
jgi:DNA-binding transcriptional regulator YhcF (GntR family)